jgi:recombination protein RecA
MGPKRNVEEAIEAAKEELVQKPKKSLAAEMIKKYGENSFKSGFDEPELEVVSSGILSVDYVSGVGGLPKGMNTVIEGLPGAGKTEIALDAMKYFLDTFPAEKAYFLDVENRIKRNRFVSRGIDLSRVTVGRKAIAETVFDIMCDVIRSHEFGMVIVDSIAMLIPAADFAKEIEDQTKPGTQGVALSKGFKKLGSVMMDENSKCINIFINQCMAAIGAKQWEPKTMAKSGFATKYLSSYTIEVEKLMGKERITQDASGVTVGNDVKVTSRKNSLSHFQHRKAVFHLNYSKGPVLHSELENLGFGYGLIRKEGNRKYLIETKKETITISGYDDFVAVLRDNNEVAMELKETITNKIRNGEVMNNDSDVLVEGD